jgi:hypothetical protein
MRDQASAERDVGQVLADVKRDRWFALRVPLEVLASNNRRRRSRAKAAVTR